MKKYKQKMNSFLLKIIFILILQIESKIFKKTKLLVINLLVQSNQLIVFLILEKDK